MQEESKMRSHCHDGIKYLDMPLKWETNYQILESDFTLGYMYITPTGFIRADSYVPEKMLWLKICSHITLKKLVLQVQPEVQQVSHANPIM